MKIIPEKTIPYLITAIIGALTLVYLKAEVLGGDFWNWFIFGFYSVFLLLIALSLIKKNKIDGIILTLLVVCGTVMLIDLLIVGIKFDPFERKIRKTMDPDLGVINIPEFHDTVTYSGEKNGDLLEIYGIDPAPLPSLQDNEKNTYDYTIDKNGFRNLPGSTLEKAQILAIGDSFTITSSLPLEKGWPYTLASLTGKQVYEAATNQTGPANYLRYLQYFAPKLAPQTQVLIGFFEGNDFADLDFAVPENSQKNLANVLRYVWQNRSTTLTTKKQVAIPQFIIGNKNTPLLFFKSYVDEYLTDENTLKSNPKFTELKKILNRMGDVCTQYQLKCSIVYFPEKFRIYQPVIKNQFNYQQYFNQIMDIPPYDDVMVDKKIPDISNEAFGKNFGLEEKTLKKTAESSGLTFISVTNTLQENAKTQLLYWPYDTHMNAMGNKLAAEEIAQSIK